jgi:hypothetical protein
MILSSNERKGYEIRCAKLPAKLFSIAVQLNNKQKALTYNLNFRPT